MKDPIMAEVRKARAELGRLLLKNPEKFHAMMREVEEQHRDRLIRIRPSVLRKVVPAGHVR